MKKWFAYLAFGLAIQTITACQTPKAESQQTKNTNQSESTTQPQQTKPQSNLISLIQVQKDNTNQQVKAQLYPIALYRNGNYVDISNNITEKVRKVLVSNNSDKYTLSENDRKKSFLNSSKKFTVVGESEKIGNVTVDNLEVGRLSCSYFIVGKTQNQQSLLETFNQISLDKSNDITRDINGNQVDGTYRNAIAIENYNPTSAKKPEPTQADLNRYKQDLLTKAKTIISESPKAQNIEVSPETVVEEVSVFDLDNDGNPEVFGKVRQGKQNKLSQKPSPYIYANLWLNYSNAQQQVISSEVKPNSLGNKLFDYEIFTAVDVNGDGVQEIIVRDINYESITFNIYEYKDNQLKEVFNGFNYGC